MDYAFAPGKPGRERVVTTVYDRLAQRMLDRRPNTTRIPRRRSIQCLHDFVQHLINAPSVPKPIEDILIGGHANDSGEWFVPLHRRQRGPTTYELLEDSYTDPSKEISLPPSIFGLNEGDPPTQYVHLKGCNIGRSLPFLGNIIFAMGPINVTAPKHFHYLYYHRHYGVFESMQYQYRVLSPTRITDRAALIAAFMATNPQYYDGTAVPESDLTPWIPRNIRRTQKFNIHAPLGLVLGRRRTIEVEREFRYRRDTLTLRIPTPGTPPTDPAARMAALSGHLDNLFFREGDPEGSFSPDHPYPAFVRKGYASKQAFLDGYTWTFTRHRSRNILIATGVRYRYVLAIPIMDRATGHLMFNYYPNTGSSHTAVLDTLETSDSRFFETV